MKEFAMELERVTLPGVGTSVRFPTGAGPLVGVVRHFDGHRELVVYAVDDPDTVRTALRLTEREAHELAEILYPHQHMTEE
jgi:TrkA domain protein